MTGRVWKLWGHASRGTYRHVGARKWVELHGSSLPLVPLLVEEWTGDPQDPEITHYGWEYADKPGNAAMIYPRVASTRASPWMLLEMCARQEDALQADDPLHRSSTANPPRGSAVSALRSPAR